MGVSLDRHLPEDELDAELAEWTRGWAPHALMARLQEAGVEACAVQSFADLQDDPQLESRGHWVEALHAHLGRLRFERSGFRLSEGSGAIERPGPLLGEHNREILSDLVGYSDAEIDRLIEEKVVA
jgi:benzylsuccinate CoA-transferase BbsF subunit